MLDEVFPSPVVQSDKDHCPFGFKPQVAPQPGHLQHHRHAVGVGACAGAALFILRGWTVVGGGDQDALTVHDSDFFSHEYNWDLENEVDHEQVGVLSVTVPASVLTAKVSDANGDTDAKSLMRLVCAPTWFRKDRFMPATWPVIS